MMRLRVMLLLACMLGLASTAGADTAVRVQTALHEGEVRVSFQVTDAVSDAVRAAIQSGLPTTFAYDVVLQQPSRWWFDRTLAYMRLSAVVRFDNLTRRYQITFIEDGRVEEVRTTDDERKAVEWLTNFHGRRLSSHRLEQGGEYHVRVKAQTRPRMLGWAWPWTAGAALGSASFRFRP
ncbi:DUF4390 domain-containing protein [Luteitalea sp.]|jgi:hypothetical protein|uniref:DUF4390 domain-containing protein n=1 Tax=Luteitalea sp. TaxID=2004800 RepID=UPI0037C7C06C